VSCVIKPARCFSNLGSRRHAGMRSSPARQESSGADMKTTRVGNVILSLAWLLVIGFAGCGQSGGSGESGGSGPLNFLSGLNPMKKANETSALAQLKKYSTAQNIMFVEQGRFAHSLSELHDSGYLPGRTQQLLAAWQGSTSTKPMSGYLFADIEEDAGGGRLDDTMRGGLAAYPEAPGESGDRVLLILLDERSASMPTPVGGGFVGGANWRLFWANHQDVEIPLTRWPSETELQTAFHEIRRRTPQGGMREAQKVMDDFKARRPTEDPVFGRD